ncbi:unnamed protein product [Meloidogyne enterolobii]|uniref:Uncharacterized protein n=1 Tax=Meloidogyne enterolobii TaxID=390850 RepID=A0ACB0YVV7_MELEN
MTFSRIVFLQIILHYPLVNALIRSTFLDDIPKPERKKYEEIKKTEFKHNISILSTEAKVALISSLSVKQSLEKNVEKALDKFNFNNKLVDKIVERIESLAHLIGEENGMSFDDFTDKIGNKLENFHTYGFKFIKKSFEEIKNEVEETNYTSKTKVFHFFYLWIWNLIEFLDKIKFLDEDIDKRMSFVEKHDIFACLPGYISDMTFADWLQNNVIRVLELKFYPHIKFNNINQAKYIVKTSVINLLPVANKKATSYIEVLQLDKIFKFNNKNNNLEQKEIILIFASVMLIAKNICLNYSEKFKVFELFEKEFLNFVAISEYLKEEYERILEILKEYFIEKVRIDSKQLEIKVINFYIKVFEKYQLLEWVKVLIDELNNEVTSLNSTGIVI